MLTNINVFSLVRNTHFWDLELITILPVYSFHTPIFILIFPFTIEQEVLLTIPTTNRTMGVFMEITVCQTMA